MRLHESILICMMVGGIVRKHCRIVVLIIDISV
jgi:hypothetical protein